ncbi:pectate lyase [Pedobacter yulinensis]|uniref:Pectate lyase n=2 Tax=Pedobacter yulinensis TaxID=2126353 RepID=A0A2T3HN11_9SPHI|nr:pectate lyase [Pedobacter yulinensis]
MNALLVLAVLGTSSCEKQVTAPPVADPLVITNKKSIVSEPSGLLVIDQRYVTAEEGSAFKVRGLPERGDTPDDLDASSMRLFEDGREIGPAHALHSEIRRNGNGRFSHWQNELFFSASDNSDPRTNGRTYTYQLHREAPAQSPGILLPILSNAPLGYASVNGRTTGGAGGVVVTVSSLNELRNALESAQTLIVRVQGNISGRGFLNIKSNKTVLGLPGSVLDGVALLIYGANNIILQNLVIRNVVNYSNIMIKEDAHHVWVDHCDLSSDRDHGWDYYDGLLDIGKRADYISVSWNRMHDNHIPMLIGFDDRNTDDAGHLRVSVYNNYFYNVSERQPSVRFGTVHCFNNYHRNGSGYAIGVTMNALVRTDNNYFENQKEPLKTNYNARPGLISGAGTNIYRNSGQNRITTEESFWAPPYSYRDLLSSVAEVPALVTAAAGATLKL